MAAHGPAGVAAMASRARRSLDGERMTLTGRYPRLWAGDASRVPANDIIREDTMNDSEMTRPRSGDQWVPSRTSTVTISVIDSAPAAPRADARTVPFGFGVRDEPVAVEAEWEGNPS
jgi:hypothetical protein